MTKWWHDRIIYQIYPRSFKDSNDDGIGDIPGIISKLDYLKELGIGAIWLSPVYPSPNHDHGYDVADYCDINPEYGTLQDMKQLIKQATVRDIKIIMDLIINHTSGQHPWFQQSRDPNSKYRDYYIWKDPKRNWLSQEKPPNNWTSFFTGPAWTKDPKSGQYYLHLFTKHQPDLNFHNPEVIEEVKKIMRFWLDLGVAGFRCDVINLIFKQSFEDGKPNLIVTGSEHYLSTDGCHQILQEFQREVWQPYDAFVVGEIHNADLKSAEKFVENNELSIALAFEHMVLKLGYQSDKVKQALIRWQQYLDWNPVFFENHDGLRAVSRFGHDQDHHFHSATMVATLLLTLRGTPFIYQGQEIGMTNVPFTHIKQMHDIVSQSIYKLLTRFLVPPKLAFKLITFISRDHSRTPMQWDSSAKAGFTDGRPWIRVNPNYRQINVKDSQSNPHSIWHYYRNLIDLRQNTPTLRHGQIKFIPTLKGVLAFEREGEESTFRIIVNLENKPQKPGINLAGQVITSNYHQPSYNGLTQLQPYEAIILK